MRTSLTRVLAGTAIAAVAALTAVGIAGGVGATVNAPMVKPPTPATTPTTMPTTLIVTPQHAHIKPGWRDLLTGTLQSGKTPLSDKVVRLERLDKTGPVFMGAKLTGAHGHVFFTVSPARTTRYELVFEGTAKYAASHSNVVTVVVLPARATTQLSITESKTTINPGQSDTISGTLTSGKTVLPGQLVWLCPLVSGKPDCTNGHLTGGAGRVFFTVKPSATTQYELEFFGSVKYLPTHSGIVTVVVS